MEGLFLFFNFYHLPTAVAATTGTGMMRPGQFPAIGANDQLWRLEGIVSAPAIATPVGNLAFW
jgi:hypothetical protein